MLSQLSEHIQSPVFAAEVRHPDFLTAFTRWHKLSLRTLVAALCGFRGGSVQNELNSFFAHKGSECVDASLLRHVTERASAKVRSKLHVPTLWALNARLLQGMQDQALLSLWEGLRVVCADTTVLATADARLVTARGRWRPPAKTRASGGLRLKGNEVMLHVAMGTLKRRRAPDAVLPAGSVALGRCAGAWPELPGHVASAIAAPAGALRL